MPMKKSFLKYKLIFLLIILSSAKIQAQDLPYLEQYDIAKNFRLYLNYKKSGDYSKLLAQSSNLIDALTHNLNTEMTIRAAIYQCIVSDLSYYADTNGGKTCIMNNSAWKENYNKAISNLFAITQKPQWLYYSGLYYYGIEMYPQSIEALRQFSNLPQSPPQYVSIAHRLLPIIEEKNANQSRESGLAESQQFNGMLNQTRENIRNLVNNSNQANTTDSKYHYTRKIRMRPGSRPYFEGAYEDDNGNYYWADDPNKILRR